MGTNCLIWCSGWRMNNKWLSSGHKTDWITLGIAIFCVNSYGVKWCVLEMLTTQNDKYTCRVHYTKCSKKFMLPLYFFNNKISCRDSAGYWFFLVKMWYWIVHNTCWEIFLLRFQLRWLCTGLNWADKHNPPQQSLLHHIKNIRMLT